jgi:hypothetical protein
VTSEGYLYLLGKDSLGLQQFGITNVPKQRIAKHKRSGWTLLDVVGPADGLWVADTESALKKYFESMGLLLGRSYEDKFDGYTETWNSSEHKFASISEMLTELRRFEEGN